MNTTRQFFARDAQVIALDAFAHAHEPLPDFPALCPKTVPLALPSVVLLMTPAPEALDDIVPALALCPSVVPLELSQFLNPDHSIRSWLTAALPLVVAPDETPVVQPIPVAPVVTAVQSRKPKTTGRKTTAGAETMAAKGGLPEITTKSTGAQYKQLPSSP